MIVFAVIIVAGNIIYYILKRRRDFPAWKTLAKQVWYFYVGFGALDQISVFSRSEDLPTFGFRFFTYLTFFLFVIVNIWMAYFYLHKRKKGQQSLRIEKEKRSG
jgi:hypothetical protein